MNEAHIILIIGIVLVIFYDFTNGFHDAADMIATAIASHTIAPGRAILLVTFFTLLGPLLGGVAVADTIGQFVKINPHQTSVAQMVVISALLSAIAYNLVTWKLGLPSSSSSSLTSGLVGAGLHAVGSQHINWGIAELSHFQLAGFMKVVTGMFLSPLVGFIIGILIIKLFLKLFIRLTMKARPLFIVSQYLSISWLAFSHGTNDAQKGMGMIAMMLFASGVTATFTVPFWVILLCATSITCGTLFGGWSIIKTVGFGIYKVKLIHSLADQIGSAGVILSSSLIGAPVSTTQVVTTTLVGIGTGEHPGHVKWKNVKHIFEGWLLNIPISIVIGYLINLLLSTFIH
ncbi:MAG: anion permease [Bacteroidia bacterium]|nr:anion permease [Bacteroidia bacterium]